MPFIPFCKLCLGGTCVSKSFRGTLIAFLRWGHKRKGFILVVFLCGRQKGRAKKVKMYGRQAKADIVDAAHFFWCGSGWDRQSSYIKMIHSFHSNIRYLYLIISL